MMMPRAMMSTNPPTPTAIAAAVDAHATRLLLQKSPPEACVDPSLGPYVTSSLRGSSSHTSFGGGSDGIGDGGDGDVNNNNAPDDLIELLENHCQITSDVARDVLSNIARAIKTGDVSDLSQGGDGNGLNDDEQNEGNLTRRSRSKSLGDEPAYCHEYDAKFLGKILQDAYYPLATAAMPMPSMGSYPSGSSRAENMNIGMSPGRKQRSVTFDEIESRNRNMLQSSYPLPLVSLNMICQPVMPSVSANGSGSGSGTFNAEDIMLFNPKPRSVTFDETHSFQDTKQLQSSQPQPQCTERDKQRSVTFDETYSSHHYPQQQLQPQCSPGRDKQRSVTFDETYSSHHYPQQLEPHLEEDYTFFEPLGGILDILDMEGEDEKPVQARQGMAGCSTVESTVESPTGEKENKVKASQIEPTHKLSGVNDQLPQDKRNRSLTIDSAEISRNIPPSGFSKNSSRRVHKSNKREANDLAAALFRPSRPRSNSLNVRREQPSLSPTLKFSSSFGPSAAASGGGGGGHSDAPQSTSVSSSVATSMKSNVASKAGNAAELNSTIQLLLTLNSQLGHEAASMASKLTDGDLNLAQYLIESARSNSSSGSSYKADGGQYQQRRRSRICRHELRGVCYRADCPYSHDLTGVTCMFWLKGRCREHRCRFLHGFAESLLGGICEEYLEKRKAEKEKKEIEEAKKIEEEKDKIHTTNLLHHNDWSSKDKKPSSLVSNRMAFPLFLPGK